LLLLLVVVDPLAVTSALLGGPRGTSKLTAMTTTAAARRQAGKQTDRPFPIMSEMRQKLLRKKKSCFFQAVICSARAKAVVVMSSC
jgi:hypothetical protein